MSHQTLPTSERVRPSDRPAGLPSVVYTLAIGVFLMGTTEFVVAGLLPEMATGMGVSVARAGLLITSSPSA